MDYLFENIFFRHFYSKINVYTVYIYIYLFIYYLLICIIYLKLFSFLIFILKK